MSSIDEQIQQFERTAKAHATARINSNDEIIDTMLAHNTTARINLVRAADALDAQLAAAQKRIAELEAALRIYADTGRWRYLDDGAVWERKFDFSGDGYEIARAALAGDEPAKE